MYHVELLKEGKYAALDLCEIRFIDNQTAEIWLNTDLGNAHLQLFQLISGKLFKLN